MRKLSCLELICYAMISSLCPSITYNLSNSLSEQSGHLNFSSIIDVFIASLLFHLWKVIPARFREPQDDCSWFDILDQFDPMFSFFTMQHYPWFFWKAFRRCGLLVSFNHCHFRVPWWFVALKLLSSLDWPLRSPRSLRPPPPPRVPVRYW